MKSANDGYNNILANACPTTSANDMVVSDDDSATAQNKNLNNTSYLEIVSSLHGPLLNSSAFLEKGIKLFSFHKMTNARWFNFKAQTTL